MRLLVRMTATIFPTMTHLQLPKIHQQNPPNMIKSRIHALIVGAFLTAVTAASASTIVTFSVNMSNKIADASFVPGTHTVSARGTFNGYGTFALSPSLDTNIYTGVFTNTTDANGARMEYKYHNSNGDNWEGTVSGNNRAVLLPATSGASLVLPTPYFGDGGAAVTNSVTFRADMAQQINLGAFVTGTHTVYVRGNLNGFATTSPLTAAPSIPRTNQFGVITSNVYTGTFDVVASPASAQGYKFYYNNGADQWESPAAVNADNGGGGNRYYANEAQTLPILDFSDSPFAPITTNSVTFSVDMSARVLAGSFSNGMTIEVRGTFNSFGAGSGLTNDLAAANTNIYSRVLPITNGIGAVQQYKFTYENGGTQWENPAPPTLGGNRFFALPAGPATTLPTVYFSDEPANDLLQQPVDVSFRVNMNGAVMTDTTPFNPASDAVYLNGAFIGWAWSSPNPINLPAAYRLYEDGFGTGIYTNTVTLPKGTPVLLVYKYGVGVGQGANPPGTGGPNDNEAGIGQDHNRVIRNIASGKYQMAQDKFGTQYHEPCFRTSEPNGGALSIGAPSGGTVPVTWLGRPAARLQVNTNFGVGTWQELVETDGTNWITGSAGTNGFVSRTNWPATSKAVFRLNKSNL